MRRKARTQRIRRCSPDNVLEIGLGVFTALKGSPDMDPILMPKGNLNDLIKETELVVTRLRHLAEYGLPADVTAAGMTEFEKKILKQAIMSLPGNEPPRNNR